MVSVFSAWNVRFEHNERYKIITAANSTFSIFHLRSPQAFNDLRKVKNAFPVGGDIYPSKNKNAFLSN